MEFHSGIARASLSADCLCSPGCNTGSIAPEPVLRGGAHVGGLGGPPVFLRVLSISLRITASIRIVAEQIPCPIVNRNWRTSALAQAVLELSRLIRFNFQRALTRHPLQEGPISAAKIVATKPRRECIDLAGAPAFVLSDLRAFLPEHVSICAEVTSDCLRKAEARSASICGTRNGAETCQRLLSEFTLPNLDPWRIAFRR